MNLFDKQLQDYREHLKILKQSRKTIEAYTQHITYFLEWITTKGIYDLKEITYNNLKEYQLLIQSKNYAMDTKYLKLRVIKQFFSYLEKTKIILYNPSEEMILPLLGDRLPKTVPTEKEIEKLLLAPNTSTHIGIRDRALLELLYSTGIRREECSRLKVYDIDYNGGYLRINNGKGGKDRVTPVGKKACDWVKEYLLKVRQYLTKKNPDERALFINRYGAGLSGQMINIIVKTYTRKAGISKHITAHAIRRGFATHMLRNEANPIYIQRILGHSGMNALNKYIKVAGIDLKKTHRKTHPRDKNKT